MKQSARGILTCFARYRTGMTVPTKIKTGLYSVFDGIQCYEMNLFNEHKFTLSGKVRSG